MSRGDRDNPATTRSTSEIIRWEAGIFSPRSDQVSEEEPLEIRVRGRAISVTMRTSGHDDELAAGFLLAEGIVRDRADILRVEPCPSSEHGNRVDVILAPAVSVDFERLARHVFAASSCGLCGKASIEAIAQHHAPLEVPCDALIDPAVVAALPEEMRSFQGDFSRTGGLHAAALFDSAGNLLIVREDVGRHNAVDKVLGHALLNGWLPLDRHILLLSGRASFEILQKSLAGRIPIIAAISAPSSLAVEFARANGQTLIGFLREGRMNIYSGAARLAGSDLQGDHDHRAI